MFERECLANIPLQSLSGLVYFFHQAVTYNLHFALNGILVNITKGSERTAH